MNKKILFTSIIIALVIIAFGYYIIRYSLDPFGAPPRGTSPNCGPEHRYKFDISINSKEDFLNFVKNNYRGIKDQPGNEILRLDNFKSINQSMNYEDRKLAEVDWDKVLSEIKTENVGLKTIYVLKYNPFACSGYTTKMTEDGHVSIYGCCGD